MRLAKLSAPNLSGAVLGGTMLVLFSGLSVAAFAGDVEIVQASFRNSDADNWSVNVTLKHADTGWDHYADAWRIVAADGTVLGTRTLYHPHENEQPFTRGLGVSIPAATTVVYVEAHDKVHGWSPQRVQVDLGKGKGPRFDVSR